MRTQKTLGTLLLLFLALVATTLTVWFIAPVSAATLYVPSQDYPTIQSAVDAAKAGDTIQVAAGTYHENIVVSTRDLTILGQNAATTIVDGGGTNTVFNIQENNVEIRQFTIRNGGRRFNGINVYKTDAVVSGTIIRDNIIRDNVAGVTLSTSDGSIIESNTMLNNSMYGITSNSVSSTNTIRNNTVSDSAYGIELSETSGSKVVNNTVSGTSYGLYVAYSNNNNVSENKVTSNSWNIYFSNSNSNVVGNNVVSGGSVGIQIMRSDSNTVLNNTADGSSYGIYLGYCGGGTTVSGNTAFSSDWGIELYSSTGVTVKQNMVRDNTWGFYLAQNAKGNSIYHNNIVNNVKQAFQDQTSSPNTWNTPTTPYQGNYWSDYRGQDTNGDGVGDTLRPWAGVDWYPLMTPVGGVHDVSILSVTVPVTSVMCGERINVTVLVRNEGSFSETFDVTAKYDSSLIGTKTVSNLAPNTETVLNITWSTGQAPAGFTYTISAEAATVPGEVDLADNSFTDGTVEIRLPDLNGDGKINIIDLAIIGVAYGSHPGDPEWNPVADINKDGVIDINDLVIVAVYYGKGNG